MWIHKCYDHIPSARSDGKVSDNVIMSLLHHKFPWTPFPPLSSEACPDPDMDHSINISTSGVTSCDSSPRILVILKHGQIEITFPGITTVSPKPIPHMSDHLWLCDTIFPTRYICRKTCLLWNETLCHSRYEESRETRLKCWQFYQWPKLSQSWWENL